MKEAAVPSSDIFIIILTPHFGHLRPRGLHHLVFSGLEQPFVPVSLFFNDSFSSFTLVFPTRKESKSSKRNCTSESRIFLDKFQQTQIQQNTLMNRHYLWPYE